MTRKDRKVPHRKIEFDIPGYGWWGILTLILMLSMHIDPNIKAGLLIQVASTLFLILGFVRIKSHKGAIK